MRILVGLLLFVCLKGVGHGQTRSVAITIDDLPCASCAPVNPDGSVRHGLLESTNRRLLAGLADAHIPVTGFVVTQTAEESGESGVRSLDLWLHAGFDLGNHSYSHPDFSELTEAQMEAEVMRADAMLRPLLAKAGKKLEFFRFPYNHTGETLAKHDAMAAFLHEQGYRVATCTIDTEDYTFAAAYTRALGRDDVAMAARIRAAYLAYSATEIDFYAALNKRVLGYEPPQVMLLHDSLLNADTIADVLALFRTRGYRFVSLTEAQKDPAYTIPDTYVTKYGPMWGYRWAHDRNLGRLNLHEEEAPDWVTRYSTGETGKDAAP
jgi:peptidoglycan/xylan/chitin deacetylase (PgdA/CDA1 family)